MRTIRTVVRTIIVLVIIGVVAGLTYIYTGGYNVAATSPHGPVARWLLETVMRNSVEARASDIEPPENFGDPSMVADGGKVYGQTCEGCHGGPGVTPSDTARGLLPHPPDLADAVTEWKPRELFWIVKHGVKMTGMPAWGPTHKDAALWSVVAFIKKLPGMKPEAFRAYVHGEAPATAPQTGGTNDNAPQTAPSSADSNGDAQTGPKP